LYPALFDCDTQKYHIEEKRIEEKRAKMDKMSVCKWLYWGKYIIISAIDIYPINIYNKTASYKDMLKLT